MIVEPLEWTVRPAGIDDAEALSLVAAATFLDTYAGSVDGAGITAHCREHHSADAYRAYLRDGARAWLVECEPGGAPIGYALVSRPELEQARKGDIELKRIYVLSRFHGTGIAGALMEALVASCAGHARILLGVKNDNHRALNFYAAHDFETVGTRRFQVGEHTYNDFVLARPLAPQTTDHA